LKRTTFDNKIQAWVTGEDAAATRDDGRLERSIGKVFYYIIMAFVLIAFFEKLGLKAVTDPLNKMLSAFLGFLPQIGGALILGLLAWVICNRSKLLITRVLGATALDTKATEHATDDGGKKVPLSATLAEVVYWFVWLLFLPLILDTLELRGLLEPVN